jgi:hypothetical protein
MKRRRAANGKKPCRCGHGMSIHHNRGRARGIGRRVLQSQFQLSVTPTNQALSRNLAVFLPTFGALDLSRNLGQSLVCAAAC